MSHIKSLEESLRQREEWVFRRRKKIPTNKRLFVLACMDERLPVEAVLGLQAGDAHVFRNAGGVVTDDAIRSAALSIHFSNTKEIIIVNHTDCGMLTATGEEINSSLRKKLGVDLSQMALDPGLPNFTLDKQDLPRWWKTHGDIDAASAEQVEVLRNHPLIPRNIHIASYIYEVESGHLRRPKEIHSRKTHS